VLDVAHVPRIGGGSVGTGPVGARAEVADDAVGAGRVEDQVAVDDGGAGVHVDVAEQEVRVVLRIGRGPEAFTGELVQRPEPARLADIDHDVAFRAAFQLRADPLHLVGIGIHAGAQDQALLVHVRIPVVSGQVLVVPDQFTVVGIDGQRGIRIQVYRCHHRCHVGTPVALQARVGTGIGDTPVQQATFRIVGTGQAPGGGTATCIGYTVPGVDAGRTGIVFALREIEHPQQFTGVGVVGRDVAVLASTAETTGAA